ncbi:hypothetical protein L9F63_001614, partial [Diploptera punctata]
MNLYEAVKTTIKISQLVGALPLKAAQIYKNRKNISKTQSIFSFIIFIIVLGTNVYSNVFWLKPRHDIPMIFVGFSTSISCLCTYITGVFISSLHFEKTLNIFSKFLRNFKYYQNTFNIIIKYRITIPLVLGSFVISTYITTFLFQDEMHISTILSCFSHVIIHISMYLIDMQLTIFLIILNKCFYLINSKLINLSNDIHLYNVRNSLHEMADFPDIFQQSQYSCENKIRLIKVLSELHNIVRMLAKQVNAIYAAHILLHVFVIFCGLAFSAYHVFYIILFLE